MTTFDQWDKEFRNQNLNAFNNNYNGLLWMKVRAICRGKQLKEFLKENNITLESTTIAKRNAELFQCLEKREDAMLILDKFLRGINNEWYISMGVDIDKLKEDLYKIQYYAWGGDQNNSLDKYFISHYVKVINSYSELQSKQAEIGNNAWNYVQNSWYNNWTSFIIESLFKRNPKVISAVGEIKSVDFFIENYPIDLKVTFFPTQFLENKLKNILGKNSLSWLKKECKNIGITCNKNESPNQQFYTLTEKLKERGDTEIITQLQKARRKIIEDSRNNPIELIRWLYENHGEMRFGAENRLYLILVDSDDFTQSWKMKRAFSLTEPQVQEYLKNFSVESLKQVDFEFKKKQYTALSDILFIVK